MSIPRVGSAPSPSQQTQETHSPTAPERTFSEVLRGTDGSAAQVMREAARSISRGEHAIGAAIDAARRGQTLSNEQLLAIQSRVYRYTQELELASKLVDKATGAIKQTLQSQQ